MTGDNKTENKYLFLKNLRRNSIEVFLLFWGTLFLFHGFDSVSENRKFFDHGYFFALTHFFLGTSLWFALPRNFSFYFREGRGRVLASKVFAWGAILIGSFILPLSEAHYFLNFSLNKTILDLGPEKVLPAGPMGLRVAFNLVLLGFGMLLFNEKQNIWISIRHFLFALVFAFNFYTLSCWIYGAHDIFGLPFESTKLHVHSLFCLFLALGALLSKPEEGFLREFLPIREGAEMGRRLLKIVFAMPIILGWLKLKGLESGWFGLPEGTAITIVIGTAIGFIAVWSQTRLLNQRSEEKKKAENQFLELLETVPDAVVLLSRDNKIRLVNGEFENLFGLKRFDLLGKSIGDFIQKNKKAGPAELGEGTLGDPRVKLLGADLDWWGTHKSGNRFPVEMTLGTVNVNRETLVLASIRDISERLKAEEIRSQLSTIVESCGDAVINVTLEGIISGWNSGAEKIFGYAAIEAVGEPLNLIIDPERGREISHALEKGKRGEPVYNYEVVRLKRVSGHLYVTLTVSPVMDPSGKILRLVVIARDVTARKKIEQALLESEDRYKRLVEESTDAIFVVSENEQILFANGALGRLLGGDHSEILGRSIGDILDCRDFSNTLALIQACLRNVLKGQNLEGIIRRPDGTQVDVEVMCVPITFMGRSAAMMVARDVTERKKVEKAAAFLVAMVKSANDGIIGFTNEGIIMNWNKGAEIIFGFSAEEMIGQPFRKYVRSVVPEELQKETGKRFNSLRNKTEILKIETERCNKKGERIFVSMTLTPIYDAKGEVIGQGGVIQDISERKKAEKAAGFLAAIVNSSDDAIIGFTNEGSVTSWNKGAENIFGFSPEEMIGKTFVQFVETLVPEGMRQESMDRYEQMQKGSSIIQFETVRLHKKGHEINVSLTLTPIRDAKGVVIGKGGILRDITEQKKAEDAYRQKEAQLRVAQKMEAIGRLAGSVAHDFNNLLSVVKGNSEFLLDKIPEKDPARGELEEIQEAVQRGTDLIHQLLVFGKKQVSNPVSLNLKEVSSRMNNMLRRLVYDHIELLMFHDKELKDIQADQVQLEQVILNLVLNARDAMPHGGKLVIETQNVEVAIQENGAKVPPGNYVRLSVRDTGTGMTEEIKKHIFEPFFTTKGEMGTGLGLATVYGIVKHFKGHIVLSTAPDFGTQVAVYFPAVERSFPKPVIEAVSPDLKGKETVLVAEDEEAVRRIIVKTLAGKGYRILEAANGKDALEKAENFKEPIDLLLTDMVMPKMSGKELADRLKIIKPGMRVLFISGYPYEILSRQGELSSITSLLEKPFSSQVLTQKIRETLDR